MSKQLLKSFTYRLDDNNLNINFDMNSLNLVKDVEYFISMLEKAREDLQDFQREINSRGGGGGGMTGTGTLSAE